MHFKQTEKRSPLQRLIAGLCAFAMVLALVPMQVFAAETVDVKIEGGASEIVIPRGVATTISSTVSCDVDSCTGTNEYQWSCSVPSLIAVADGAVDGTASVTPSAEVSGKGAVLTLQVTHQHDGGTATGSASIDLVVPGVSNVAVDASEAKVMTGEQKTLTVTCTMAPSDFAVTDYYDIAWSSNNEAAATVAATAGNPLECVVTAVADGTAEITCTMTSKQNPAEVKTAKSVITVATYTAVTGGVGYDTLQEAVEAAADGATVTLMKDVDNGTGVKVASGKNVVIDFNGHTYYANEPLVGSTGTKTSGFQLLTGATVTLKNGTLASTTAKVLVQNYADLTVEDLDLVGGTHYCLSVNHGDVVVTGDSSVTPAGEGVAVDLYYGMASRYEDGLSVTFDENYTGTVTGPVTYGKAGRVSADDWADKAPLNVEAGTFNVTLPAQPEGEEYNINISGGSFDQPFDAAYGVGSFAPVENGNGGYGASADPKIVADTKTLWVGESLQLTVTPDLGAEWTWSVNDALATISATGLLTAKAAGTVYVTAKATKDGTEFSDIVMVEIVAADDMTIDFPDPITLNYGEMTDSPVGYTNLPGGVEPNLSFEIEDDTIISVAINDMGHLAITGLQAGETTMTLYAGGADGKAVSREVRVIVKPTELTVTHIGIKDTEGNGFVMTYNGDTSLGGMVPSYTFAQMLMEGEVVALGGLDFARENANVGDAVPVKVTGTPTSSNSNYTVVFADNMTVDTVKVEPKAISGVTVTAEKVFDNTTAILPAEVVCTIGVDNGVVANDDVSAVLTGAVFNCTETGTVEAGGSGSFTASGITLTGADAGNYSYDGTATGTVTINAYTVPGDVYDIGATANMHFVDANDVTWLHENAKITVAATSGYTVSDAVGGSYADSLTYAVDALNNGAVTFYVQNEAGHIGVVTTGNYKVDTAAPSITITGVVAAGDGVVADDKVSFDNESLTYTVQVSDAEAGVDKWFYTVTYVDEKTQVEGAVKTEDWVEVAADQPSVTIQVEKGGYLSLRVVDKVTNTDTQYGMRALVVEKIQPSLKFDAQPAVTYEKNHEFKLVAEDSTGTPEEPHLQSGIQKIKWELAAADGSIVKQGEVTNTHPASIAEVNAQFSKTTDVISFAELELNGDYEFEAVAYDWCGNSSDILKKTLKFDNTAPTAELVMSNDAASTDGTFYYMANNCGIVVNFADVRLADGGTYKVTAAADGKTVEAEAENGVAKITADELVAALGEGEKEVTVTITAVDKAGNAMTDESVVTVKGANYEGKGLEATFVLDTVAPVLTVTHTPDAAVTNPDKQAVSASDGYRFFYDQYTLISYAVEETYYDFNARSVQPQQNLFQFAKNITVTDYEGELPGNDLVVGDMSMSQDGKVYTYKFKADADGIYVGACLNVADRAGNLAVATDDSKVYLLESNETVHGGYAVVIDTVAPVVDVTMSTAEAEFYALSMQDETSLQNATVNNPYQSSSKADVNFVIVDTGKVALSYAFDSTLQNVTVTDEIVENCQAAGGAAAKTHSFNGQQRYKFTNLVAVDRAGNQTFMKADTANYFYLDTEMPGVDELAPTVVFEPIQNAEAKGVEINGVMVYDKNTETVTITAKVEDPYFDENTALSSGLKTLYYRAYAVNYYTGDKIYLEPTSVTSAAITADANAATHTASSGDVAGTIQYAASSTADANMHADTVTFTFKAADFNYNEVVLHAWADDNAGNLREENVQTEAKFGLDLTPSAISIVHSNNDVRNDRYFKADRPVTITVTERNFDAAKAVIKTQIGVPTTAADWTEVPGSAANGDDMQWVCSLNYGADGNYTIEASVDDMLSNGGAVSYEGAAAQDFVVDKTAPVISVDFDNNAVRNGRYYNRVRTATIAIAEVNFRGADAVVDVSAAIAEGTVTAPGITGWVGTTTTVPFTADGDYSMSVDYTDLAGNAAANVSVAMFTVDTTAPTLEIGGVADRSANRGEVAPSITYHDVNYNAATTRISITGYKNTTGANLTGRASENAMGGSFVSNNIEAIPANDDVYTCIGHVEDMAGNVSEQSIMFSVNRFGSNYILGADTETLVKNYYTNTSKNIEITEINVDTLEFQEITASVNGEIVTLVEGVDFTVTSSGGDGTWKEYHYVINADNFTEDGVYNVTVYSRDAAQNENSNRTALVTEYAKPIDFVMDTTLPTVVITGVEDDEQYIENSRLITAYVDDNVAMAVVRFYLDDELVATFEGDELANAAGTLTHEVTSKNSWQVFRVEVVDCAGNQSAEAQVRFLLTSNLFVQYINNLPAVLGSAGGAGALFFFIFWKRRKKEEDENVEQTV